MALEADDYMHNPAISEWIGDINPNHFWLMLVQARTVRGVQLTVGRRNCRSKKQAGAHIRRSHRPSGQIALKT
jgi:hypothetical protein